MALAVLAGASCGPASATGSTIKVGAVFPLSGARGPLARRDNGGSLGLIARTRPQILPQLIERHDANMLRVEPHGFGVERFRIREIHHRIAVIDIFKGERIAQFMHRHLLAIVFLRPPQQTQEID